ncbi:flagellar hook capping FlgD N-terminal domain-containing protein [uncultured Alsobacter sp.]|uniref:flagellar hook assembly protein FlgD n=1 Tax=uncultured Alsobacter sp. TaxID=1748258 RepID=UPI0025E29D68|nr:flagellar hook capping FlgD N-terminal domain-containing protein [uncultured Alsobacter sp.]
MATSSVNSSTSGTGTTSGTSTASSSKSLANNFDQFLTLLTTQLKNQSPLDPLDTNQFTAQLVQFASVEQQIKSNDTLAQLLVATKASTATNALGFVGMEITADGTTTKLENGKASWTLTVPRSAPRSTITVRDSTGATVYSEIKALDAGTQSFTWDGQTANGTRAPNGNYTISVSATDVTGKDVNVQTQIVGVVDSVDLSGSAPALKVGAASVSVDQVKSMRKPSAS